MIKLNGFSATATQIFQVSIISGELITLTLAYRPAIQMWFISVVSGDLTINNIRVCNNINLFSQYADVLNWGLFVEAVDGVEPGLIDDFEAERFRLNILSKEEVDQLEGAYSL